MQNKRPYGQRELMRKLVATIGRNEDAVCAAYADAEADGNVARKSNAHNRTPEEYARALWRDAVKKGWL
jgi:hypothetical protein